MAQPRCRSVLITGCSRGIGLGLVRGLAAASPSPDLVFATCRYPEKAQFLEEKRLNTLSYWQTQFHLGQESLSRVMTGYFEALQTVDREEPLRTCFCRDAGEFWLCFPLLSSPGKAAHLLELPNLGLMPNSCSLLHELQQLSKQYSNIKLLQLDVVCENSIKKVVKEVEEIVGDKGLNCLINNAGINVLASLEEVTAETMLTIYETNTVAQLMVTKAFLPLLRKAAQLGTGMGCHRAAIINMSSLAASMQLVQANEMFLKVYPYRIAKTALNMITRCLAADLKSDGILCISLHPGWLQTDMGGNMAPMQVQEAIPGILSVLDRLGEKENGSFLDWQGETLPW